MVVRAEQLALVAAWAPAREPAWRLTSVLPPAPVEPVPSARPGPAQRSALAAIAAPETLAAKPVAKRGVSAFVGGAVLAAALQAAGLAATGPRAARSSWPQTGDAGNRSVPRPLQSADGAGSAAQCGRESGPGDHLRGSGLMASPRIRGEPWRSHALKAPPRRNTGALLAGCAPARPLGRLYGRVRSTCQLQGVTGSMYADHFADLRYTTSFSPGSWSPGCALS